MTETALIVEDDALVAELAQGGLAVEGFQTVVATTVADAKVAIRQHEPDLIVLDIGLPDASGLGLLMELRGASSMVPVLILSGRADLDARVLGLRMGADDYLTKPFSPIELGVRARAVLRRSVTEEVVDLAFAGFVLEPGPRRLHTDHGAEVGLTRTEFDLLHFLARHPERSFTRAELLDRVWHSSSDWQQTSTVTEYVRRLRRKLGEHGADEGLIATTRGHGYRLDAEVREVRPGGRPA